MRTTVELPDRLFRMAKRVAAERGLTLRDLFTQAMEHELSGRPVGAVRARRDLPAVKVPADAPILHLTPDALAQADSEAECEHLHEVCRRR